MAGTDGLDERFVTTRSLEEYFVDKDTGLPLAGGSVQFWQDASRTTPKLVYQLTGDPSTVGGYEYVPLPNPITLSGVGTIDDGLGNNIPLYYFPYQGTPDDSDGTLELYYVVVLDRFGVVQFTRSAWPNVIGSQDPTADTGLQENQISNGQFADFSSYTGDVNNISYTGNTTTTINIAPDWELEFTHTSDGTLIIEREAIAGSSNIPTNPPYYLKITPGLNIYGNMILRQTLPHNPGIWYQTNDGKDAYVVGGILLANGSQAAMTLKPSAGADQVILNENNTSGGPKYFTATKKLPLSDNGNSSVAGNIALEIAISSAAVTRLSSVQLMGSLTGDANVPYIQETVNRQEDHMFHYYKEPLVRKAIPSYLTGWDFPLNPAQFGGRSQTESLGTNESKYVWDQTIMYQSVAASFRVTGTPLGAIQLDNRTGGTAQFALIQYLDQSQARKALSNLLSVQVSGCTSMANGLGLTVSLWYTTDSTLPDLKTPNFESIVGSLDVNGKPATFNGTWVEVPTIDGVNKYGLLPFGSNNDGDPLNFEYWDTTQVATACTTATYFAIVVGSAAVDASALTSFRSISLVPGTLATAPAPQTLDQVAQECKFYYQKSYEAGTAPGTPATYLGMRWAFQALAGSSVIWPTGFQIDFIPTMRITPSLSIYASVSGNVGNVTLADGHLVFGDIPLSGNWRASTPSGDISVKSALYVLDPAASGRPSGPLNTNYINYHYEADARLGVKLN